MSPCSFWREYWSALVYQVSQPGVVSCSRSSSSLSRMALVPMILMPAMRATSPSKMSKVMPTRLRSSGVIVGTISTEYLPRARYWRLSSCTARSSKARSKMRASAKPTSASDLSTLADSNSRIPLKEIAAIAGRSSTMTTTTSFSTSIRTSRKKPVPYSARTACVACSSVKRSPTLTGRYPNTVPASVRWMPSTRMSRTTKGSKA